MIKRIKVTWRNTQDVFEFSLIILVIMSFLFITFNPNPPSIPIVHGGGEEIASLVLGVMSISSLVVLAGLIVPIGLLKRKFLCIRSSNMFVSSAGFTFLAIFTMMQNVGITHGLVWLNFFFLSFLCASLYLGIRERCIGSNSD